MNSLDETYKTLAMALIFLVTLPAYATGGDLVPSSWSGSDPAHLAIKPTFQQNVSTHKIVLSGAVLLLKDTRIVKNLDQYKRRLTRNFRFEYRRTINSSGSGSALGKIMHQTESDEKEPLKTISFSGELDHNMSPILEFNSRLNIIDVSSTLHLIGHEVECDISSRPVNDFLGGRAGIGFSFDGEKTQALIRLKFMIK